MKLRIALEWFLNPDHLPFIYAQKKGYLEKIGIESIELIEPKAHYDGFDSLKKGEIEIAINEPIHLLEHYDDEMLTLGCYFETKGGVMLKPKGLEKMLSGESITITTPVANEVTDKVGFEILRRFALAKEVELEREKVTFVETDFYHIKNLQEGDFDGAWLCFENYEKIEAEFADLDLFMIDASNSPYANFSALDLITTKTIYRENREVFDALIQVISEANVYLKSHIEEAKELFYAYTGVQKSDFEDRVIEKTVEKLLSKVDQSSQKWKQLYLFLKELEIVTFDQNAYENLFLSK